MRDWTGSGVQRDALTVQCSYCFASVGELCRAKADPSHNLVAFPAHVVRIKAASQKGGTA